MAQLLIKTLLVSAFLMGTAQAISPLKKVKQVNRLQTPVFLCHNEDDRIASSELPVGRVLLPGEPYGCTLTLIGKSCAVSAGHCLSTFSEAHFNVPSSEAWEIKYPHPNDIYQVEKDSVTLENKNVGNDWAVLRLAPNSNTGLYPGEAQGFLEVATQYPEIDEMVRVSGYGRSYQDNGAELNYAQQTGTGPLRGYDENLNTLFHRANTSVGSSGSAIVSLQSNKIVGIHTHGGCSGEYGVNYSTFLLSHQKALEAVQACLQWEEDHLY